MADKKNKMDVEVSIKADKQDITQLEKQLQQAVSIDGLSKVSREIIQFIDLSKDIKNFKNEAQLLQQAIEAVVTAKNNLETKFNDDKTSEKEWDNLIRQMQQAEELYQKLIHYQENFNKKSSELGSSKRTKSNVGIKKNNKNANVVSSNIDFIVDQEDIQSLNAYAKAYERLQKIAKSVRNYKDALVRPDTTEQYAVDVINQVMSTAEAKGEKLAEGRLQQIFKEAMVSQAASELIKTLKSGEAIESGKGYVGRTPFSSFISDGNFVSNSYINNSGAVVPKSSYRIYSSKLKGDNFPQFKSITGETINTIANYYQELVETGSKEAIEYAKQILEGTIEAIENTKTKSVRQEIERKIQNADFDTGDYFNNGYFWNALRANRSLTDFDYGLSSFRSESMTKEEKDAESRAKDEAQRVRTGFTGVVDSAQKQLNETANYINSDEFKNTLLTILSGGIITDINGNQIDYSNYTSRDLRDLFSTILSQTYNTISGNEGIQYNTESMTRDGSKEYYDEENYVPSKDDTEFKSAYRNFLENLYQRVLSLNETLTKENQEKLRPTIEMLENSLNNTQSLQQLVNSISNFATFGESVLNPIKEFGKSTGIGESQALNDALIDMDSNIQEKVIESSRVKNQIDQMFENVLQSLKTQLLSSNLNNSKNTELSKLVQEIQNWSVQDLIDNLSRLQTIQLDYYDDLNSGSLGKFYKSRNNFNDIIENFNKNLFSGFSGLSAEDKNFKGAIEGIQQFKDDMNTFYLFVKQFYSETYGIGVRSINFNAEEAQRNERGDFRPIYSYSPSRETRTPKARYLGMTRGMDVLANYGANIDNIDIGLENAQRRLSDYESKLASENEERQKALETISKIDQTIAENEQIIKKIVDKYPATENKSAIGGYKIDWKSIKQDPAFAGEELSTISEDQKAFKQAQENIKKLKESLKYISAQEILKDIGEEDRSTALKSAIERIKEDIEYIVKFRDYVKREFEAQPFGKQIALPASTSTKEDNLSEIKRNVQDTKEATQATEQLQTALKQEEQAVEQVNKDLESHSQLVQDASEAEKGKVIISQKLETQLGEEANAYQEVNKEAQQDSQNRYGHVTNITGFIPNFDSKAHQYSVPNSGETFFSATQLRDALIKAQNPSFKVDLDRIKAKATEKFNKGLEAITVDDFEGMTEKDFKFMVEEVIAQGIRGDVFHSLIDKMVRNDATTLEELAQKAKVDKNTGESDYTRWLKEYENAVQELQKYGIEEAFLGIQDRLESYMDARKKSGLTPTKFSEQRLAFRMEGERGAINIGVTPDQLYSMNGIGAFMDTKTGNVKGMEAFQLTAQLLGTLANLDAEFKDTEGNVIKLRDLIGDVDTNKPMKAYIADVQDGMTKLTEYLYLSAEEFYNLAMDAQEIKQGKRGPLSKEEQYSRMNRQLKTGSVIGMSSNYEETINDLMLISPRQSEQLKIVRDYIKKYTEIGNLQNQIAKREEEIAQLTGAESEEAHKALAARKEQLKVLQKQLPEMKEMQEDYGNGNVFSVSRIGDTVLDSEVTQILKELKSRADAGIYTKQVDLLNSAAKKNRKITDKEQNTLIKEYKSELKELLELELALQKLQNTIDLEEIDGLDSKSMANLEARKKELTLERDYRQSSLDAYGYDSKNGIFTINDTQYRLSIKNAQKLADEIRKIENKNNKDRYDEKEAFRKKMRSSEEALNNELIALNKKALNDQLKLEQLKTLQLQNPEGNFYSEEKGKESSQQLAYLKHLEEANTRMEELKKKALEFGINLNKATSQINLDNAGFNTDIQKEQLKQSAIKGTGQNATKTINQYLNNYKQQLKIQEQIYALEKQMETQDGIQLRNSEIYKQSLENQLSTIKSMAPQLNVQEGTINGIKITQEQLNNLLQQQNALDANHASQLNKINAQMKEQRSLVSEIIGGFKQAFRNMTDASIAYEIIGLVRQSITQLIQTTKELDSAMVDLQIASGETRGEIHDMMLDFTELGDELGRTTQDIAEAANDWLRAGYTGEAAAELTRASAQLSTLGMISTSDATSYLISVLKGWKIEASEVSQVVDKLTVIIAAYI